MSCISWGCVLVGNGLILPCWQRQDLFAVDPTNFNIKATKQSTRNGALVLITTYDDYIIVGTKSSIDFWDLGNYSNPVRNSDCKCNS